jgi:hypothetical protein
MFDFEGLRWNVHRKAWWYFVEKGILIWGL